MNKENSKKFNGGSIVIYRTKDGQAELKVQIEKETVWLTQAQIASLFGTQRPAITKHLNNIFKSGELEEKSVSSILEHTAADGKIYQTKFYSLDAIVSVGYRVNSKRATQFRIWATQILKSYLIKGYAINQHRLAEQTQRLRELQNAISFIKNKAAHSLLQKETRELFNILDDYAQSFTLLQQYDEGKLKINKQKIAKFILKYEDAQKIISEAKTRLIKKKEASELFGREVEHKFESIINAIRQTFSGRELYRSVEEKAANLLYLIIKDHPFTDGNKRAGALFFIFFLEKNDYLWRKDGTRKINDSALVALALLIAVSDPKEKEVMIKIITNLLRD
ncbi:hypothetical protein COU01_00045 [Candidatus Falkowbacteria bacterium CG10_big_fil_rev_8_21_14_0_10_44_15]|uniref:Fido domain-containing protein n=1 Tax=Candidatus Falkowbacteria bacterium CG10_big_fil_rev_8_21_14_0_10_44_15 TaxID=1974569 RepID=A0A2H0V115_9BACT|nr:MAG: hypothetical protein COU01_00045 [Candidatus Falkowbacteria bacterium CG10_big_fil_rev_8_21_14_0_10_44_15]